MRPVKLTGHALDDLYLGPDDDIEYDSVSSSGPDVLCAIPGKSINCNGNPVTMHAHYYHTDQSLPAHADHPGLPIDPDLYLGPDDDLINYEDQLESADAVGGAPAAPQVSMTCRFLHTMHHSILNSSP